jgi:hypothetical protein
MQNCRVEQGTDSHVGHVRLRQPTRVVSIVLFLKFFLLIFINSILNLSFSLIYEFFKEKILFFILLRDPAAADWRCIRRQDFELAITKMKSAKLLQSPLLASAAELELD